MLKGILKLNGVSELEKKEQSSILGGFRACKVYDQQLCESCGGTSLANGCCLIASDNEQCLEGFEG